MTIAWRIVLSVSLAVFAAGLVACGASTPIRFYTLDATAVASAAPALAGRRILVGPVEFPSYLERPQMAIRGAAGQIDFMEYERWAEPLDAAFTAALVNDLIVLAGTSQAMAAPVPSELRFDYRVRVRVTRFDVDASGQAVLVVQWYLADSAGKVLVEMQQDTYRRDAQPGAPDAASASARAAALSATIADFAADVVRSISSAGAVAS
jgi:uncharacterized protein